MSFSNLSSKARKKVLLTAKRQRTKNTFELREDNRPIQVGTSIKTLYNQLNKELFDEELKDIPVFYNNRLRRVLGKAAYRIDCGGLLVPLHIEIRTNHRWTPRFKRKVLTHEMCHIWAYQFHNESGHKKMFWEKMSECGYPKYHDWQDAASWEKDIYC